MNTVDIVNNLLKFLFINLCTYFIFLKIINQQKESGVKSGIIFIISIVVASLYIFSKILFNTISAILISYTFYAIMIATITKNKINYSIVVTLLSLAMTFIFFIISIIISSFLVKLIIPATYDVNLFITLFVAILIEIILICKFLKLKKFKNGLAFVQHNTNSIGVLGIIVSIASIIVYLLLGVAKNNLSTIYLILGAVILAIGIIVWAYEKLKRYYKKKMKDRTIEQLEEEIKQKDEKYNQVLSEHTLVMKENHEITHKISALESFANKLGENERFIKNCETELGLDILKFINQINVLSEGHKEKMKEIKGDNILPKTNIFSIDNILTYLSEEASKNNIEFNLKINDSVNYMVENIISIDRLETLISDHIKDAIIAIKSNDNSYRSIMVMLGIIDGYYEFSVYDTGIEFEIDTLLNLGLKPITTHKEDGGTGIGFMSTFETLNKCRASLIIEEKKRSNTDYTKAVIIRFDDKGEYRVCSYRAEEIKLNDINNRLIIENLI